MQLFINNIMKYFGKHQILKFMYVNVTIFSDIRIRRDDIEDEDDQESYYNYIKNAPVVAYPDDEEELEYDSDGNPIAPEKSKVHVLLIIGLKLWHTGYTVHCSW